MEKDNQMVVQMSKEDLDNLIYYTSLRATTRALDKHFRGLLPFLNDINRDNAVIIEMLDYLKTIAQQPIEKPKKRATKKKKAEEVAETDTSEFIPIVDPNSKLSKVLGELSEDTKAALSKAMQESMQKGITRNMPEIKLPKGYDFK